MKLQLRIAAVLMAAVAPFMGLTMTASANAVEAVVPAKSANICGPSYKQVLKDRLLNTQDDQISNGNLIINWSYSLHTWCLVGTSTGNLALHRHSFWGAICLDPDPAGSTGTCNTTKVGKSYKILGGLDKSVFVLKMSDPFHRYSLFTVQTSNSTNINKGNIYTTYDYAMVPAIPQPM